MATFKYCLSFEKWNFTITCKEILTFGCIILLIAFGRCTDSVSLSIDEKETLEYESATFTCSFNGSKTELFSHWKNYTNNKLEPAIGLHGNSCIATGFLNDSSRFSWSCYGNSSFSLTIKRVTRNQHLETWRCRQKFLESNNITIHVKVPVETVNMYQEDGNNDTVMENEKLAFICNTSYSRPAANISLLICPEQCLGNQAEVLSADSQILYTENTFGFTSTQSYFEIRPDRSKHGWHVFCVANNLDIFNVSSNRYILDIIFPPEGPPKIHGDDNIYRIIENKRTKLTCSTSGSNPLPDLFWECYNNSTMTKNDSTVTSSVSWIAKRENKKCVCRSIHISGNQSAEVYFDVLYSPHDPNLTIGSLHVKNVINKLIDTPLVIHCKSKSNPPPNYVWRMPNSSISRGDILNISHTKMSSNGTYYCKADNIMTPSNGNAVPGTAEVSVDVHILFPPTRPELRYGRSDGPVIKAASIFVVEYDSVGITCNSLGNPEPEYTWNNMSTHKDYIHLTNITQSIHLSCMVTNSMNDIDGNIEGKAEKELSIIVLYPPRISDIKYNFDGHFDASCSPEREKLSVLEYSTFSMECNTDSKPNPSYSWYGPLTSPFKTIEIRNVSRDKKGYYTCSAFNTMERSYGEIKMGESHKNVFIDILYPPTIGRLENKTVLEGSSLNISCPVSPGNPTITTVLWTREDDNTTWPSGELYLPKIKRLDAGIYECLASNTMSPSCKNNMIGRVRAGFHINIVYKTKISKFYVKGNVGSDKVTLHENDSFELVCETDSRPKSYIRIDFNGDTLLTKASTNTLTYAKTKASCSDHGIYTCHGNNIYNNGQSSVKFLTLHVTCSPRLSGMVLSDKIFTLEGKSVSFIFTAIAFPIPESTGYKWQKEQQESIWTYIKDSNRIKILSSGLETSLSISEVTDKDFGIYKLSIENPIGIYHQTFHLLREGPPAKPTHFEIIYDRLTNTTVTLSWETNEGHYKPNTFILQFKEENDNEFLSINLTNTGDPFMNYTITNLESAAWYLVQITSANVFGISDNITMRFQTKSCPSQPEEIKIIEESITETSLTVEWIPGYNGGEKQNFSIYYKIMDRDTWETMSTFSTDKNNKIARQYLGGLEKGSSYQLYLIATNSYGTSNKSTLITFQTKQFDSFKCEERQSYIIWILTGLLVAVAVIAISITIFFKRNEFKNLCQRKRVLRNDDATSKRTSKHELRKGNIESITNGAYDEMKEGPSGTQMVELRQQYEELEKSAKDKTASVLFGIYEDVQIPNKENMRNIQFPDGYEVPQSPSLEKKKLIVNT